MITSFRFKEVSVWFSYGRLENIKISRLFARFLNASIELHFRLNISMHEEEFFTNMKRTVYSEIISIYRLFSNFSSLLATGADLSMPCSNGGDPSGLSTHLVTFIN
jgi:hypothetical protein